MFQQLSTTQHNITQAEEKAICTTEVIFHIHRARTSAYFYLERKKERKKDTKKWQMRSLRVHVSKLHSFRHVSFFQFDCIRISQQTLSRSELILCVSAFSI